MGAINSLRACIPAGKVVRIFLKRIGIFRHKQLTVFIEHEGIHIAVKFKLAVFINLSVVVQRYREIASGIEKA